VFFNGLLEDREERTLRVGGFTHREVAAATLPFLAYHVLVFAMLKGFVPGYWSTFPLLMALAAALAVYGLVLPIRLAWTAHARDRSGVRAWLISQGLTLACWFSGFILWEVLSVPTPDGP
jgi:hypothetical protein